MLRLLTERRCDVERLVRDGDCQAPTRSDCEVDCGRGITPFRARTSARVRPYPFLGDGRRAEAGRDEEFYNLGATVSAAPWICRAGICMLTSARTLHMRF